jgi:peptidoglycan/LPS O-acetylase OafA/YrhL
MHAPASPLAVNSSARPEGAIKNIAIQQLRGVAILLVLFQHLSISAHLLAPLGITNPGYAGVELFFVISGYVVTRTMMLNDWSVSYFVSRRVFRLYPPILVFLGISFGVVLFANTYPDGHVARIIFGGTMERFGTEAVAILTGTMLGQPQGPLYVNGAMWSLSVEFQFYLAVAAFLLVAWIFGAQPARVRLILKTLALGGLAIAITARFALLAEIKIPGVNWLLAWKFDFLVIGVALALAKPLLLSQLSRPSAWALMVGSTLVALGILTLNRSQLEAAGAVNWLDGFAFPLVLLLFGGTVALSTVVPEGVRGWPGRVMTWVGDRSYTIYLLHFPFFAITWFIVFIWWTPVASTVWTYAVVQVGLGLGMTFIAAEVTFRLVEKPCIAWGGRLIRGRRAASAG